MEKNKRLKKDNSVTTIDHENKHVILPYGEDQFNNFIKGLLGKSESINSELTGIYNADLDDIVHLYNLLDQRIKQQNISSLISFSSTLTSGEILIPREFIKRRNSNRTSVTLDGIDSLKSYNETRPIEIRYIELEWNYLVKFQDKETPEKQKIIVRLNGHSINYSIRHTARTWGIDIENLLTSYADNIFTEESIVKTYFRKHSSTISVVAGIFFFIGIVVGCFYSTLNLAESNIQELNSIIANNNQATIESVNKKIDKFSEVIANGVWGKHYFKIFIYILLGLVMSILVGEAVKSSIKTNRRGFILLSKKSYENRDKYVKNENKFWFNIIRPVFISIATGVLANYVFQYLT